MYTGHLTAFGADINTKVTMGNKYKFVPKEGPPPGLYNPDMADGQTKPKQRDIKISPEKRDTGAFLDGNQRYGAESANDPGKYDGHLTAFGSDINTKVTMGNKYKFVPKEGPPPGLYNPDMADGQTKPKQRDIKISPEKRDTGAFLDGNQRYGAESANDPGKYDGHLTAFGSDINTKVTMGNKYKFVPKEGPPPGLYNPDMADGQTKPKQRDIKISPEKRDTGAFLDGNQRYGAEAANDPGMYDGHLKAFGADINTKVTMGNKYKFVPKEGPPPGLYDPDLADGQTKPKQRDIKISPEKRDTGAFLDGNQRYGAESANDPGKYDGHLTAFGADVNTNITMGNKYKFVPKEGPPPGLYNPDMADG